MDMKKALFCILLVFLCFSSVFTEDTVHKVKKGETLYSISKKYGITVKELCLSAGIKDTDVIKEGQLLSLPKKEKKVTSEKKTDTYEVKAGDTLYSLAKKWDITVDTLKVMNMMAGNDTIKIGQILIVPQKIDEKLSDTPNLEPSSPQKIEIDPRNYDTTKTAPKNAIWPVKVTDIVYLKGKTSGVQLSSSENAKVTAIKEGRVMFSGLYRGFGQVVFVQASGGYMYVYSGLNTIAVAKDEKIAFGDELGTIGIDSISGKHQMNLMVFKNGKPIDPGKAPRG